jgi:hemin uptake protein HemP
VAERDDETCVGTSGTRADSDAMRTLRSEDIFLGRREVVIEHAGQHYRLTITSAGKLILTK